MHMLKQSLERFPIRLTALLMAAVFAADALPRPAFGEEPHPQNRALRYLRDYRYERMDRIVKRLNIRETRESLKTRIQEHKNQKLWLIQETRSFIELAGENRRSFESATDLRDELRATIDGAAKFTNGTGGWSNRAAMIRLFFHFGHDPEVRQTSRQPVDTVPADDFAGHRYRWILMPDGSLRQPPTMLMSRSAKHRGVEIFRKLRHRWDAVASVLSETTTPYPERLADMERLLQEWETVERRIDGVRSPSSEMYLEQFGLLIEDLNDADRRAGLVRYLSEGGHAFPGGTREELLRHVLEHQLTIKPYTTAQRAVGELTKLLIDRAETKIASLQKEIDHLRTQNVAHTAAMRQRLVPAGPNYNDDFSGKNAGLDSPAYTVDSDDPKPPAEPEEDTTERPEPQATVFQTSASEP